MADTTTRYSLPFQETGDAPDGPSLGGDLAQAVETALGAVEDASDAAEAALDARLDTLEAGPAAWSAYTPAISASTTPPTMGNGTLTGRYSQQGKNVNVRIECTFGSTSTFGSGVYFFSLPVAPKLNSLLSGIFLDSSAGSARYGLTCHIILASATGSNMRLAIDGTTNVVGASLPVVVANGDTIILAGTYEAN